MSRTIAGFSPQILLEYLVDLPACKRMLVGFSGGADSTALLLALHQLSDRLECDIAALHFNHGLQDEADDWQEFCGHLCQQRQIPLQIHQLTLTAKAGASPETMAREARYAKIRQLLTADDIYLTAHHADDQAETVLLHLLRGSGAAGLAGIPRLRRLSSGWLARPLLDFRREALEIWLNSQNVQWICDTSNFDQAMDRNFLRGRIIPQLEDRWPGVVERFNQSAKHLQQRSDAFEELLSQFPAYLSPDGFTLGLNEVNRASKTLQAEIIRHWAQTRGAPPPPRTRLQELLEQLQHTEAGSHSEMVWRGWSVRQHNDKLWMHELPPPPPCPKVVWQEGRQLDLGAGHGKILVSGKSIFLPVGGVICSRSTLEPECIMSQSARKKLKEIMRIYGVPDWLRDTIPLLLLDGKLSAIGDWWFSAAFKRKLEENHQHYYWQISDPLLRHIQSLCNSPAVDPDGCLV